MNGSGVFDAVGDDGILITSNTAADRIWVKLISQPYATICKPDGGLWNEPGAAMHNEKCTGHRARDVGD